MPKKSIAVGPQMSHVGLFLLTRFGPNVHRHHFKALLAMGCGTVSCGEAIGGRIPISPQSFDGLFQVRT